jgi:hypothetical protein
MEILFSFSGIAKDPNFLIASGGASICSLLLTILIYSRLFRLAARITLHSRRNTWIRNIRKCRKDLALLLRNTGGEDEIHTVLVRAVPTVHSLQKALPCFSSLRYDALKLRGMIFKYQKKGIVIRWFALHVNDERLLREIYLSLLMISEYLKEQNAESKIFKI